MKGIQMRILIKKRGTGKTTGLIYTSESTGYPIVVSSKRKVEQIIKQANELECIIPAPVTFDEIRNDIRGTKVYDNILIDIQCVTMSNNLKESYERYR